MTSNQYKSISNTSLTGSLISATLSDDQSRDISDKARQAGPHTTSLAVSTANVALSDDQLRQAANGGLYIDASGLDAARSLTVGADTAARALAIQTLFGLTTVNDSVTLKFPYTVTGAAFALSLANVTGTSIYVKVSILGGTADDTQQLATVSASANTLNMVQVTAGNVTAAANTVTFNILQVPRPQSATLAPVGADIVLTDVMLLKAAAGGLPIDGSGLTGARALTLGADSTANAKRFIDLFGLTTAGYSVMLYFPLIIASTANAIDLENTGAAHLYVNIVLDGATPAATKALHLASSIPKFAPGIVLLKSDVVTAGAEVVTFNILRQGSAT